MSEFAVNAKALLIGVGDYVYSQFQNLPPTVRDVQAISDILTNPVRCGYLDDNIEMIIEEKATSSNIRTALQNLAQSCNVKSTVFIYFSGHGGQASEAGAWQTYLCPREAELDDLDGTAISGSEFSELLASIPAQKMLVILDACHAGGAAELKSADGATTWKFGLPDIYYETLSLGSGRVVIASSKENQFSYIRQQGDLSLFTWHLCEALNGKAAVRGDGMIYVLDVFHYTNEAVKADEPKQTPTINVKDMDLNFPIALDQGKGPGSSVKASPIADIREQIISDPDSGAKLLCEYLKTNPEWSTTRDEVDLRRSNLKRIQHDLDLFGQNPADQALKSREIYFLLHVCVQLEQADS